MLVTLHAGELLGERSFWGLGNRGKTTSLVAESEVQLMKLDFDVRCCSPSCCRLCIEDIGV